MMSLRRTFATAAGQVRPRLRRLRRPAGPPPGPAPGPPPALKNSRRALREVAALRTRVEELEAEVQECRHLNKRLAEVTDVVAEVLLPAAQRDDDRLRRILDDYTATL
ncbi:MAG: DUF6752 domain-containing protein [Nocardioidaceae bacterium]